MNGFTCRLMSERGDSNARPLRPERSALPTALLSETCFGEVVSPGIEPGTQGFSVLCSTN